MKCELCEYKATRFIAPHTFINSVGQTVVLVGAQFCTRHTSVEELNYINWKQRYEASA